MTSTSPLVKYRHDYQSPAFAVQSIALTIDIQPERTTITSVQRMKKLKSDEKDLILDGQGQALISVDLDQHPLPQTAYAQEETHLSIFNVPDSFTLTVKTSCEPQHNKLLMGLYLSNGIYCTQCETEGFRRMTYYLDRPDVMSIFTTTIIADKKQCPVLLANGNLIDHGQVPGGRHFATWQDPFKKPSYLFAMVAGNLACLEDSFTTMSQREVTLKIYAAQDKIQYCTFAMQALKKAMRWDEEVYGREYDLDIFMIVAVNDFNFGAMENKGLNIFNDRYILVSPETATDSDYEGIDAVVSHEYFHNWSGNRVTLRDWFQLSLKEGFTVFRDHCFTQDVGLRDVVRIQAVKRLRRAQFPEDAGPLAHPIRPDAYIEMSNFYTTTIYEKGAEVIGMLKTILGPVAYRKATDLYFSRHDGEAVTCDDFVQAMSDASGRDLTQFKLWYAQAGTPEVTVVSHYDEKNRRYTLTMTQHTPETPGQKNKAPMLIPIRMILFSQGGQRLCEERVLELTQAKQVFVFEGVTEPPVASLLRAFSAPVRLKQALSVEALQVLITHDDDGFSRFEAMTQFVMRHLLAAIEAYQATKKLALDQPVIDVFKTLLTDRSSNPALLAEMLTLPTEADLAASMDEIDVEAIHVVHQYTKKTLAGHLFDAWQAVYEAHQTPGEYRYVVEDVAKRSLKNVALSYLACLSEKAAYAQFTCANNMTDQYAALCALSLLPSTKRDAVLEAFYQQWQTDALVLDKWFSVQAMSDVPQCVTAIQSLMANPKFSLENPNKVRALLGTFANHNPIHFHTEAGYALLTNVVLQLDNMNPMVAARLIQPLAQWRRYPKKLQQHMKAALQTCLAKKNVSKDVYEIASKALA